MNRKEYNSDPRYAKVLEQMDLLGIMDISTTRQYKNGTIVWKLPIKDQDSGILIEVASFASGYVRNQGKSTRSNYQLNKTKKNFEKEWPNGYRYYSTERILIPIEIDRLEYLISYCLKNYYIKGANQVADGNYVSKWRYDNLANAELKANTARLDYECGHYDKIRDLENKLDTIKRISDHENI